jgi:hypothetical protein
MFKKFSFAPLLSLIIATGVFGISAPASADPPFTVCASGCAFTSIQAAINAATPGGTVKIGPGHYAENLTIGKSVSLVGSGNATVVYPSVSKPNPTDCVSGGGTFCDARNGIIDDWTQGTFTNLIVSHVTVRDIYLRGIEAVGADFGETFAFNENTVANVQGSPSSIAIFNRGGSGVISGNKVSQSNDAISANWSKGTRFVDNVVTSSASGIHTDNNGGAGGTADFIRGNTVRSCMKDGYGIWVYATYASQIVDGNVVKGCYIGLAVFGSQSTNQGPTFSNNVVNGGDATTSDPLGTYGAYVATDLLGIGAADVNATFTGDSFKNFTTGLFVTQTTFLAGTSGTGQATVSAHGNAFRNNDLGANGQSGTIVNATGSWWGCASGPNTHGCDTAVGTVSFTPWLTKASDGGDDH